MNIIFDGEHFRMSHVAGSHTDLRREGHPRGLLSGGLFDGAQYGLVNSDLSIKG